MLHNSIVDPTLVDDFSGDEGFAEPDSSRLLAMREKDRSHTLVAIGTSNSGKFYRLRSGSKVKVLVIGHKVRKHPTESLNETG